MPPKAASPSKRLWPRVDSSAGPDRCWPYTGRLTEKGYGRFTMRVNGDVVYVYAHRLAYELANGDAPGQRVVRHACDNPRCCNPAHLLIGTHRDNNRDMLARGRHCNRYTRATHCIRGHLFDAENTYWRPKGDGRACKACAVVRQAEYLARKGGVHR